MVLAGSLAMLTACASSANDAAPRSAPDPVVEVRTVTVVSCPAEVTAALPARPIPDPDARLDGNEQGMAWLRAILSRLSLIEDRLSDASTQCH